MRFGKSIAMIGVVLMAASLAVAQGRPRRGPDKTQEKQDQPQAKQFAPVTPQESPQQPPPGARRGFVLHGPGPHMGDWLRKNQDLPVDQQMKALEQDPDFQRLPADRQEQMRHRLQRFNSLPLDRRDAVLQRMETFEHLPPDQQQKVRGMFRQFRDLSPDRRRALNGAFRNLEIMSPEQRQKALASPDYRNNFTGQEIDLLRGMSSIGINPSRQEPNTPSGPPR
ncbi:MAG: DUF3106 domain-containing protein [Terriglobales bacterium]